MRKLVIGIAVVALLALTVVPAMAYLAKENLNIEINVATWCGIRFSDATLTLDVTEPWEDGKYGAAECKSTKNFTVLSNAASTLTVTAQWTSTARNAPGVGFDYPIARYIDTASKKHYIGFGVTLRNLATPAEMAWDGTAKEAQVGFNLGDIPINLTKDNAQVQINSYMDSSRGSDALCPPGEYTTYLILTLTTTS